MRISVTECLDQHVRRMQVSMVAAAWRCKQSRLRHVDLSLCAVLKWRVWDFKLERRRTVSKPLGVFCVFAPRNLKHTSKLHNFCPRNSWLDRSRTRLSRFRLSATPRTLSTNNLNQPPTCLNANIRIRAYLCLIAGDEGPGDDAMMVMMVATVH